MRRIYVGNVNETEDGDACLKWTDVDEAADFIGVDEVGDHNYCRNPGRSKSREYCYISQNKTDYCKARTCEFVDVRVDMNTNNRRVKKQITPSG